MQSLRTRKPQAPRKDQREASKPGTGLRVNARKSRVDDKIKKRMSMRYAEISSPTELNGVPAVPSLPTGLAPSREAEEYVLNGADGVTKQEKSIVEVRILDDENFDADAFLKTKLARSTEAEIKTLQSTLRATKDDTSSELQKHVFENYAEFVLISKEISTLENEMLELKESLSEYKSMPSLLHIPDPSSSSATVSTYRRSSVADLRILYFNQMQTLHAQIEGSSKFAPTTPGRHIIAEHDRISSLNAATYKAMGRVKFVVMDDMVLVARRRRRGGGDGSGTGEGKLVAERCWPLNEMLVLDTKDSPSMTNVFKIRHGKETHVYRTDAPADKRNLLSQFRQVAEELAAKKRKEREGEHERRKSMWIGGGDRTSTSFDNGRPSSDWMVDLARQAGAVTGQSVDAREKAERDARSVAEWSDELTVAISLRQWDKAVELIEQGKQRRATTPSLSARLPGLNTRLVSALLESLSLASNRKSTVVSLIALLLRLDAGPAARTTFLEMRTRVMRSLIRKIKFEGHVGTYVGDLAIVVFTGIKHTADWFLASFKDNEAASAFIEWAKRQIESYAEMFRKQVYSIDVDPMVVEEAKRITYSQSRKLLQEYGLDFRFMFDGLLVEHPNRPKTPPRSYPTALHVQQVQEQRQMRAESKQITPSTTPTGRRSPASSAALIPVASSLPPLPSPAKDRTRSSSSTTARSVNIVSSMTPTLSGVPSSFGTPSTATPTYDGGVSPSGRRTPVSSTSTANSQFAWQSYNAPPSPMSRSTGGSVSSQGGGSISSISGVPSSYNGSGSRLPSYTNELAYQGSRSRSGSLKDRERRPPRTTATPPPPPRSHQRPGSVSHRPPPVAVPQREGMI